jgi:hypothetical protein
MDWKSDLHEKYRKEFGCKNIGEVCWCKVCVSIEKIIEETVEQIKNNI